MDELIFDRAEQYVRGLLASDASGHDIWHTVRVTRMAVRLAKEEGADADSVRLAALLHDTDDIKLFPENGGQLVHADAFMKENGLDEATRRSILSMIRQVSFKGTDSIRPDTLEAQIVQDADRLDAIGAIGISRTFAYGGTRGRAIYDPDDPPQLHMNEAQYRSRSGCSVNHFYEKLLLLKDMMTTESARRIAEQRHLCMEAFLKEFMAEWRGEA